ncbi:MAG: AAA family ATPase [Xanthomonadales bacterium]|nr:AAA family ATPase [Xanthomonadales bacterium]
MSAMNCAACAHPLPETAKFCPECGHRVTGADDGERRHATILFSDLSGYTALNECLDPEEVEAIMDRVKRAATTVIARHGGIINQFVGDEVVALFGIPTAHRDDAVRAVRAASELHREVRDIAAEVASRIGRALTMHSGINTGLIVARRSDSRDGKFALTGDVVNTAARLLHLADKDEIVVSQDTWRDVAGEFEGVAGVATEVRGKEKPIVPWRILGARASTLQAQRPLIGRAEEVARFERRMQDCLTQGRGGLILMRGDAGIGKSRLATELGARAARAGFVLHRALVLDFGAERGRDAVRALAQGLAAIAPKPSLAAEHEVFLAALLDHDLRPELRAMASVMDEATRDLGVQGMLVELARSASLLQPQFLLIEDAHWADTWTLARLASLAELARAERVLLVVTTRREQDPGGLSALATEALDLHPLSMQDMAGLADQYADVPQALAQRCIERAEGNPLFLEQLLLNADETVAQPLPGSIQGLVLARMDRLPAVDRAMLQAAAVIGQRFSLDALRHLLGDPQAHCHVLLDQHLVRPEADGYLFWHALIRDGAYESLLKSRRRRLHALAAEWFAERDAALAAEHYDLAGDERAPGAYWAASEQEVARYRYERALALTARGLELATAPADRIGLLSMRARVLLHLGHASESIAAWQAVMATAGDGPVRCRALIGIAAGMRIIERVDDGLAALAEAEPLARRHGLHLELSRLHHLRGNLHFGIGRADDCLREHEAALAQALVAGSPEAEANALGGLGDAYYVRGHMRSAREQFARCVALAQRHGFGRIEVANLHMVGWATYYLMQIDEALAIVDRARELARAVSHQRGEMIAEAAIGLLAGWCKGEIEPAEQRLQHALGISQALGAKRFEGELRVMRAMLVLRRDGRDAARIPANEALAYCRRHGMDFFGPVALGLCARLSDDEGERQRLNDEAVVLLDAGALGHCHIEFAAMAIESAIERGAWNEVEHYCRRLERYTCDESLPLCDFIVRRGRALAARARGEDNANAIATLAAEARTVGLDLYLQRLAPA